MTEKIRSCFLNSFKSLRIGQRGFFTRYIFGINHKAKSWVYLYSGYEVMSLSKKLHKMFDKRLSYMSNNL